MVIEIILRVFLMIVKALASGIKKFADDISSGIRGVFHEGDHSIPGARPIREIGEEAGQESPDIILDEVIGEFILVAMKFI